MDQPVLDHEELAALRDALQERSGASAGGQPAPRRVMPVALISDDRAAERARPLALRLANRWAELARARVARLCGVRFECERISAEIVDAATIRDELGRTWLEPYQVSDRPGTVVVSASGPVIEVVAARLLGATPDDVGPGRTPSATAMRVFTPVGRAFGAALADAWRDEQRCELLPLPGAAPDAWRSALDEVETVAVLTLTLGGPVSGRVRLIARAEALVPPKAPPRVTPAPPGAIDEVLGAVPIEVRVELGRTRVTMGELAALRPGSVLLLDRLVDDPLPVSCARVVKAVGRALVSRGALAVEVVSPSGRRSDS